VVLIGSATLLDQTFPVDSVDLDNEALAGTGVTIVDTVASLARAH
jgi:hypothetical protein